jgi:hypothetical protein
MSRHYRAKGEPRFSDLDKRVLSRAEMRGLCYSEQEMGFACDSESFYCQQCPFRVRPE